ncbi:MAG TPA: hypothetical protein VHX61_04230 [Rhizomicrobium sp.]|jgi:hypothetical protein|nr:hypothetical protein [Rhizomicrobium sp.]
MMAGFSGATVASAEALAASPELFPHALDLRQETVTLLRLSRADYEQASFLDGRIAGPAKPAGSVPFAELASAVEAADFRESCYFIFHIGHVGSTLLSRLLGRHPALFSVREPEILRTLALMRNANLAASYLPVFLRLWSRTYDAGARAVVKASSFVSDLASQILVQDYAPRALVMGVAPETYLATIFGGENAPREARALAPFRLARLRARLGCAWRIEDMSEGEIVALGWACEATALAAATAQSGGRVHIINFDRFLARPQESLGTALAHFGVPAGDKEIGNLLDGAEMRTYSKAPEFAYDAALRQSVLAEGRRRHATEIRRGLQWLERMAREHRQLQNAFELFQ